MKVLPFPINTTNSTPSLQHTSFREAFQIQIIALFCLCHGLDVQATMCKADAMRGWEMVICHPYMVITILRTQTGNLLCLLDIANQYRYSGKILQKYAFHLQTGNDQWVSLESMACKSIQLRWHQWFPGGFRDSHTVISQQQPMDLVTAVFWTLPFSQKGPWSIVLEVQTAGAYKSFGFMWPLAGPGRGHIGRNTTTVKKEVWVIYKKKT